MKLGICILRFVKVTSSNQCSHAVISCPVVEMHIVAAVILLLRYLLRRQGKYADAAYGNS